MIYKGGSRKWPTAFDVPALKEKIQVLETKQAAPDFWSHQEEAAHATQELARMREELDFIESSRSDLNDSSQLLQILKAESDEKVAEDMAAQLTALEKRISEKERTLRFDGPYDKNAAIMTIQAGAGGTDAADFAQMLERMYMRYGQARGWRVTSLDRSAGEEAGVKSTMFEILGA